MSKTIKVALVNSEGSPGLDFPDIRTNVGAAVDYLSSIGMDAIARNEHALLQYANGMLGELPGLRPIGTAQNKAAVLSFTLDGIPPHDVGTLLNQEGIAVRTGHHCTQPIMDQLGILGTVRASFSIYNTHDEVKRLFDGLRKARTFL